MEKIKWWIPAAAAAALAGSLLIGGLLLQQKDIHFTNEDFIRFHVIANSDSDRDQNLKLKVRDGLVEYVNAGLRKEAVRQSDGKTQTAELNIEQTREFLIKNIEDIEAEAMRILQREGCEYKVKAELGICFIPEKSYGSLTFPAGSYEALNVTIGSGGGQNWWCVLYPPLCLIDSSQEEKEDVLRDAVMQGKYSELYDAAHGKKKTALRLRFRTLEILEQEK